MCVTFSFASSSFSSFFILFRLISCVQSRDIYGLVNIAWCVYYYNAIDITSIVQVLFMVVFRFGDNQLIIDILCILFEFCLTNIHIERTTTNIIYIWIFMWILYETKTTNDSNNIYICSSSNKQYLSVCERKRKIETEKETEKNKSAKFSLIVSIWSNEKLKKIQQSRIYYTI